MSGIKTVKIKLTPSDVSEVEHICDMLKENWDVKFKGAIPEMFPEVTRDRKYLIVPLIKRVVQDLIIRSEDAIDIADDNIDAIVGFDKKKPRNLSNYMQDDLLEYKKRKAAGQKLKKALLVTAKKV